MQQEGISFAEICTPRAGSLFHYYGGSPRGWSERIAGDDAHSSRFSGTHREGDSEVSRCGLLPHQFAQALGRSADADTTEAQPSDGNHDLERDLSSRSHAGTTFLSGIQAQRLYRRL